MIYYDMAKDIYDMPAQGNMPEAFERQSFYISKAAFLPVSGKDNQELLKIGANTRANCLMLVGIEFSGVRL